MSFSNRLLFAALSVLVLIGASPPTKDDQIPQTEIASDRTGISSEPAPASSEQASEPALKESPCSKGEEDRSSDLCAQWKAADGASSAADAAWWIGGLGLLVGALTLGAAAAAAKFARDAAVHTEAGAVAADKTLAHARAVAAAELRPYLAFTSGTVNMPKATEVAVRIGVRNFGSVPAVGFCGHLGMSISGPRTAAPDQVEITAPTFIAPGQEVFLVLTFGAGTKSLDQLHDDISSGKLLWVAATVTYEFPGLETEDIGEAIHETFVADSSDVANGILRLPTASELPWKQRRITRKGTADD